MPVSALILVNEVGEFLCVVEKHEGEKVLNFPVGKEDYADNKDLEVTAFRETKKRVFA